jgi:hypothetical protein
MIHKVALIPSAYFHPDHVRQSLSEVVALDEGELVSYADVPEFDAKLLYVRPAEGDVFPELYYVLKEVSACTDYNKIVASYVDGWLNLAIAQGHNLLLANVFRAMDFTTAEYFIFLALKKLQLNPEVSSIVFRTPLSEEESLSLYRYFKSVEQR